MLGSIHTRLAVLASLVVLFAAFPAFAQTTRNATGKLKIHVSPKQAYVFVDGKAIRDGSQSLGLSAGSHEVGVYNYGYLPKTQSIEVKAGETTDLNVDLQLSGDKVAGPFGDIEFKGHPRAAVLLNGTTPDYFVGHVDEFDWNWIWHQRLLVKPGTYQVMVTREGNTIWSGPVTVKAGQQVTVYLDQNGKMKTKDWPEGNTMRPQPRFYAGIASATVPVAPVTAQLNAQATDITCGKSTDLNWKSANAVAVSITDLGNVAATGDRSVSPDKTTTYQMVAKGPGGVVTEAATVDVSGTPTATLSLSEPEVHFHKVGDKVVQDDAVTLTWSTSNANRVTIDPLGVEPADGSQTIHPQPKQMQDGPVNETWGYTLKGTNACGGTVTKTDLLHVVGSIDPAPSVTLTSIFYPTAYPQRHHPKVGLVASERKSLEDAASGVKDLFQYDQDVKLMVVAHADIRGSKNYNEKLTERRAELVKNFLVSQGIPADKIQTRAEGKDQELSQPEVTKLQAEDPQEPEKWMLRSTKATWLAYNRRVDVVLEPNGQQSEKEYPNTASDVRLLWERPEPSLKAVEAASGVQGVEHAQASGVGN